MIMSWLLTGTCTLMALPRLLLFWLSDTVTELLHRASNPRIPPTQSPMTHTCVTETHTHQLRLRVRRRETLAIGFHTDLPVKGRALQRPDEVTVHLVGSQDDRRHGVLVLRRGGGQKRQSSQRDVVLTAGEAALVVAVRAQTAGRQPQDTIRECLTSTQQAVRASQRAICINE